MGLTLPTVDRRMLAHDLAYPFQRQAGEVRTWHVWVDRLSILFSRLLAKLVYQLKALTASLDYAFLQGAGSSVFWGGEELLAPTDVWRWPNFESPRAARGASPFAVVFFISNQTSLEVLDAAWNIGTSLLHATDVDTLFLEDSIRQAWITNYRPVFAGQLASRARQQNNRIEVLWRRHQATLSNVIIASEHFGERLGNASDALHLACVDLRLQTDDSAAAALPSLSQRLFQWAEGAAGYSGRSLSFYQLGSDPATPFLEQPHILPDFRGRVPEDHTLGHGPGQLFLQPYLDFQRRVVQEQGMSAGFRALVYVCNPFTLCGGHGDRTNGIISAFTLALLTSRAFFIDFDSPLPLTLLLQPRTRPNGDLVLDWRVNGLGSVGQGAHSFYLDDRISFQEDLTWLLEDPSNILHVSMNHRELKALLAQHLVPGASD